MASYFVIVSMPLMCKVTLHSFSLFNFATSPINALTSLGFSSLIDNGVKIDPDGCDPGVPLLELLLPTVPAGDD